MYRLVLGGMSAGSFVGVVQTVQSNTASPALVLTLTAAFMTATAMALFTGPLK